MRVLKLGCLVTFARVLVDVDMSGKLFDSVLVEKEGRDFLVAIEYENNRYFVCTVRFWVTQFSNVRN